MNSTPTEEGNTTMYTLTYEDSSEDYATYEDARAAQRELNAMGMIGSSIEGAQA